MGKCFYDYPKRENNYPKVVFSDQQLLPATILFSRLPRAFAIHFCRIDSALHFCASVLVAIGRSLASFSEPCLPNNQIWLQHWTPNREVGSARGNPRRNSSKSAPVIKKFRFNMCFYPYGVHIIKVLALGPLLAILIFQGSQMTLMTTKMTMFFRQKHRRHPLMTPLSHCNNEKSNFSASVPPISNSWILFPTHFVAEVRFFH